VQHGTTLAFEVSAPGNRGGIECSRVFVNEACYDAQQRLDTADPRVYSFEYDLSLTRASYTAGVAGWFYSARDGLFTTSAESAWKWYTWTATLVA
jgi:hypothetical protein